MSERPKVQISKVCVVHSHPGFESQRYRHQGPRYSTRGWVPGTFVCSGDTLDELPVGGAAVVARVLIVSVRLAS